MKIARIICGNIEIGAAFGAGYLYCQSSFGWMVASIAVSIVAGAFSIGLQKEITLAEAGRR